MSPDSRVNTNWLKPSIHPSYPRLLCAHLRNKGIAMDAVFQGNSLSWDNLLETQRFVSFEQFRRIALNAMSLRACPWLGLEISSMIQVSAHGAMGYGAVAAQNVRQAFKLAERMMPTRLSIYSFELIETDDRAYFKLHEQIDAAELREFILVMLLGSYFDMLEKITGQSNDDIHVQFPYAAPQWLKLYQERFPTVELSFDHEHFSIDMPIALLDMHCLTTDEFAYRNAVRECEQLLAVQNSGGALADKVKSRLFASTPPYPTQDALAAEYAMSTRTLIRHLKREGTSYQALLDEVRKELACWHLQNVSLSVDAIADILGFQDTSNFSRVFRRWLGCRPSDFRFKSKTASLSKKSRNL